MFTAISLWGMEQTKASVTRRKAILDQGSRGFRGLGKGKRRNEDCTLSDVDGMVMHGRVAPFQGWNRRGCHWTEYILRSVVKIRSLGSRTDFIRKTAELSLSANKCIQLLSMKSFRLLRLNIGSQTDGHSRIKEGLEILNVEKAEEEYPLTPACADHITLCLTLHTIYLCPIPYKTSEALISTAAYIKFRIFLGWIRASCLFRRVSFNAFVVGVELPERVKKYCEGERKRDRDRDREILIRCVMCSCEF